MNAKLFSILIPVYNERAFVERLVHKVLAVPLPEGLDRELVIVDDGSTDGTAEKIDELQAANPEKVRVFHQPENLGKGAAVIRAIEEMRGDVAIFQDADLEYDPGDYMRLLEPILSGRADVVYGSRFASASSRRVLNYHHELGNRFLTFASNITTGLNLTDMETCYKVFRADILRTIPIRSLRFGIEPEITAKVAKRKCVVYEVPISYYGRDYTEGKKIGWRDGVEALFVISKYWMLDDCFSERYGQYVLESLSATRRFSSRMVDTIEPFLGQRILEVGSGIANISRLLPKREWLTLSDRDPEYLRLLEQAFGEQDTVDVRKLDLDSDEDFDNLSRQYDTVVCLNVLEHVEHDAAALRRLVGALEPGGRLILLVPQYEFLMSEMDRSLGHYRRYTREAVESLMREVGLDVEHVQNFNGLAILGWWLNAKLMGSTKLSKMQLKFYDSLVPMLSKIEPLLPLPGISVIAVGRRKV